MSTWYERLVRAFQHSYSEGDEKAAAEEEMARKEMGEESMR